MDRGPETLGHAVLAEFMRQRLFGPHIRRMRTEYARRRQAVVTALAQHCPAVTPLAAPGGLHMVLQLARDANETTVVQAARARGLAVAPLSAYYSGAGEMTGLVIGFATTPTALAADAARRLAASVSAARPRSAA
jgi:GntR family transcriptional regulator/MocR family aminotransferase